MKRKNGPDDDIGAVSLSPPSLSSSAAGVYELVREVPPGKVTTYGAIALSLGLSPRYVGGVMARSPEGVAWWRVVGAKGAILTTKIGAGVGEEQTARLRSEGVPFDSLGRVVLASVLYEL